MHHSNNEVDLGTMFRRNFVDFKLSPLKKHRFVVMFMLLCFY